MRVELLRVADGGVSKGRTGTGALADSLKEGDTVRAQVLSSAKGFITMKTEDGVIFKARMDAANAFSPGDKVLLELTSKENDTAYLSIREDDAEAAAPSGKPSAAGGFEDKSLAPFAAKLAELKMPVAEGTARTMQNLISQNPGMSLDEAAFLASNKLTGNEDLMKAALAMLSSGEKTDAMLGRLLVMLDQTQPLALVEMLDLGTNFPPGSAQNPAATSALLADPAAAQITAAGPTAAGIPAANGALAAAQTAQTAAAPAPLMEWASQIGEGLQNSPEPSGQVSQPTVQSAPPIITHTDTNLQSRNTINNEIFINNDENFKEQPDLQLKTQQLQSSETGPRPESPPAPQNHTPGTLPSTPSQMPPSAAPPTQASAPQPSAASAQLSSLNSQLSSLLAELPEFRNTPAPVLERFSDMLLRVAGDSAGAAGGDTDKLKLMLDKLFTKIERNDQNAGERLRNAREELFARLSFIEEAAMRASPSARVQMQEQTQRLMQHVRLLNNIDQFVYMQLPVAMGDDRKSAELYLFKKKGGKRADPENVNILLALDLEHMGHWEGLINIRSKDVSVKMDVSGVEEKEHFSAHTVLLHSMLSEAGFKLVSTDISYSKEETTPLTALAALDRHTAARAGKVDFMI